VTAPGPANLEALFRRAEGTDPAAAGEIFALLYDELHRLAERQLRRSDQALTLGTTTLVHEAYLSMAARSGADFPDRARFFGYAARAMRGLIIDYARRRCAVKRGRLLEITLQEEDATNPAALEATTDLTALGAALEDLTGLDPALAELVDLHYFAGFALVEIAELRGVAERTVQRDWRKARLLLHRSLGEEPPPGPA
jgi:RNA polymerase sigma factor (TIGR02999 family)